MFLVIILFCCIVDVFSSPAINLYECKSDDEACVTHAVQVAYPLVLDENTDIDAERLDPMFQNEIEANLATLKFKLINTTIVGFRTCQVGKAKFVKAETLQVILTCPYFHLKGLYEITGQLLSLPVERRGDYLLNALKYKMTVDLNLNTINRDGKNFRHVKNIKVVAAPLEPITFDLRNMFNGRKDIADEFLKFVNKNWRDVALEVQDPIFEGNIKKIVNNANKYLRTLPIDEYTTM